MKRNLIKKSLLCVLSLSFCALLASCKKVSSSEKSVSKTNVFANSDVLAYAKKNKGNNAFAHKTKIFELDTKKYNVDENTDNYVLLYDNDTSKPYLYLRNTGEIIDIDNNGEYIDYIYTIGEMDRYGYIVIEYYNDEKTIIDYNGNTIIEKKEIYSIDTDRLYNNNVGYEKEFKFYDLLSYTEEGNPKTDIFEIKAKIVNGGLSTEFERKAITSDEIDYSIIDRDEDYMPLKNLEVYSLGSSFIVKDLKGNLKATFSTGLSQHFIILDDKIVYQTTETVTINDSYTYNDGGQYYVLRTFQVDLNSGVKTEIKDYGYVIESVSYTPAYSEKNDRDYIAGNYAQLTKIEDKRLSTSVISAMVDKNGNILSTKIGEKGSQLSYVNDNTYALYDGSIVSILDKKGNNKGSFYSSNVSINYEEETILAFNSLTPGTTSAYILDTDLKLLDMDGIRDTYSLNLLFDNGNAIMTINDHEAALVKFENKKVEIIEKYDYSNSKIDFNPSVNVIVGCKYVTYNSSLASLNMYLVTIKTATGWDVEVHTADGELVRKIENVSSISTGYSVDYCLYLYVYASSESYAYGTTIVSSENE